MSTVEKVLHEFLLDGIVDSKPGKNWDGDIRAKFKDGNAYTGSFKKGYMDGEGEYFWKTPETRYAGQFQHNKINGSGKYSWKDGSSYVGDVKDSLRHGHGRFQFNKGPVYEGDWKDSVRQGNGILYFNGDTSSLYEGDWHQSSKTGKGKMLYPSGSYYIGEWKDNIKNGQGKMVWKYSEVHQIYDGSWQNGKPHGIGTYYWLYPTDPDESVIKKARRNYYEGEWVEGKRGGSGTFFYSDGTIYTGEWKENKKHGKGTFIDTNGNAFTGNFTEDKQDFIDRTAEPTTGPVLFLDDLKIQNTSKEYQQLQALLFRYYNKLKEIYVYYSNIPNNTSDESLYLNNLQFSQLLADAEIVSVECDTATLIEKINSALQQRATNGILNLTPEFPNQHPLKVYSLRDFLESLVRISYWKFVDETSKKIEEKLNDLLTKFLLKLPLKNRPYFRKRRKEFYKKKFSNFPKVTIPEQTKEKLPLEISDHWPAFSRNILKLWTIYTKYASENSILQLRDFLTLLKETKLINLQKIELVLLLFRNEDGSYDIQTKLSFFEFLTGIGNISLLDGQTETDVSALENILEEIVK